MARKMEAAESAIDNSSAVQAEQSATESDVDTNTVVASAPVSDAVAAALAEVNETEAALAVATRPIIRASLEAALVEARGLLALAEAEAALQADRAQAESEARASVESITNPERRAVMLASMLQAIEVEFSPVAPAVEQAAVVEAAVGRRKLGARHTALNAAVASDTDALDIGALAYTVWLKSPDNDARIFGINSGTRYPSFVPLASTGNGVANYADLERQTAAVRHHMRTVHEIDGDGNSTAEAAWLAARGKSYGPNMAKHAKCGIYQFTDGREVALCSDGRFRLSNAPDARFISDDDAAYALFTGGTSAGGTVSANATVSAPTVPASKRTAVGTPTVPTAPTVAASASTGKLAKPAHCQHCGARNVIGDAECATCHDTEWLAD